MPALRRPGTVLNSYVIRAYMHLSVLSKSSRAAPPELPGRTVPYHEWSPWLFRLILLAALASASLSWAQDNYEIQVYGSETVAPGDLMAELHSNSALDGRNQIVNGVLPTQDALHETLELTQGITPWFEIGGYLFTSIRSGEGWQWVGDHIRPRVRVPEDWHWPVGLSLSLEGGYSSREYAEDTWTLEIRPIIDKQMGRWYVALNPALERSFAGYNAAKGFEFAPAVKVSYDVTKLVTVGLEYYASFGPMRRFDATSAQEQYIFPALDLNFSPDWEFNFGVGFGLTRGSDNVIVKMIIGRRFHHL